MALKKEKKEKIGTDKSKNILPGAIILALFVSVIVFMLMLNAEKNALIDYEKGMVYTAVKMVPKGQIITEANIATYFETKELDKKLIPSTALADAQQIYGLLPIYNIDVGTIVMVGMFESLDEITSQMKEPVRAGFKVEDLYQVVTGTLRAGDRIHIYICEKELKEATLVWENVFIEQVFDVTGNLIDSEDKTAVASRVNIIFEKENIEQFYAEISEGNLRVVKVLD